ncbi:hypothetical protein VL15_37850 [Burkholderia cepacia]|uniref:Fimbrial protein n=1 Tax=Burkholderia cepacia TaxID=292 RepID=A0A0J5VYA6_BURCE|nr:fimbrial biogenesis usher protein [Burkholderia cepacia]KML41964.1 hypothetical protein VL15_37850 [Burkholderia cepacia]
MARLNDFSEQGYAACQGSQPKRVLTLVLVLAFPPISARADTYFNPAFLSGDPSAIADLSRFSKTGGQAPGTYRVDVYLNDTFVSTKDVTFKAAQPAAFELGRTSAPEGRASQADAISAPVAASELTASGVANGASENAIASAHAAATDNSGLQACITVNDLDSLGVNLKSFPELAKLSPETCVDLPAAISHASTTLDFEKLRLDISIPQAALNNSARGYIPPDKWDQGINAGLLNYSFSGSNSFGSNGGGNSYFLNMDSGINLGAWRLRDSSTWNYSSGQGTSYSRWQNVSTYVERTVVPLKAELIVGDANTTADVFDSLGFRGAQIASDDNMLPDSLRGFAPTVRGIARSNAQVTIKQNGYVIYQTYVPPGPFTINDLFPTASSGDMNVSIKESDGSVTSYTVPYSAVPILQREGRIKFATVFGKYRSGNSNQENPNFLQNTVIWGLPHGLTAYGGVQLAEHYRAFAVGLGRNLGDWGALSADVTQANATLSDGSNHSGQSLRFLYAKSLGKYGTNFQLLGYRYSTEGFYTLDQSTYRTMSGYNVSTYNGVQHITPSYNDYYNLNYTKKGKLQINISQSVGHSGSIFVSATQQSYWHTSETNTLMQAGYTGSWRGYTYSLTYNYNKSPGQPQANQVFALTVSVPLSKFMRVETDTAAALSTGQFSNTAYATYSNNTDTHGNMTQQLGVSGTLLASNNLTYSIQQGYANHDVGGGNGAASLNYQGTYGNANLGYNYSRGYQQVTYGVSGGALLHRNGVTFSQPLGDTNVLIAAPGAGGVSVQNATGVKTDWRGYAVVPYATTYRQNRISLDVNTLNDHTDIDEAVNSVVPTQGAVVLAPFKVRVGARALLTLTRNGQPIPFGAAVNVQDNNNTSIVGDQGQVYLTGLPLNGQLKVQWGDGPDRQCTVKYSLSTDSLNEPITRAKAECK